MVKSMGFVTYVKEAIRPGGTPDRYLIWVSVVLFLQAISSVLPSPVFYNSKFNLAHAILIFTVVTILVANLFKSKQKKILAAYALYIVGLILSTVTIASGITSLSGIVFMLTWAMTLFIAERREYISFDLVTVFMVLMLISTVILLLYNPDQPVNENWIVLATGGFLTAVDIYLVYTDFGYDKNYYQEYRKKYANLQVLSSKLSEILSAQDKIETLLWKVANECVPFLGLEDCVIYLFDEEKKRLIQVSAYGDKSTDDRKIVDPLEIEVGKGIVGKAFESGKYILIDEVKNNPDYIVDDAVRNSELAVPIFCNGKVVGVVDSEHTVKGFFLERHVQAFQVIAAFCGIKIAEQRAKESIIKAERLQIEADHYKEVSEMKNQFITNISHDLKTPLSLIKGPAHQIKEESNQLNIKKYSDYILKNTEHLSKVVGQLLQLNRVDKGLNQLYLEEVNNSELIDEIASHYKGLSEKKKIKITIEAEELKFVTDRFRLEQIIHNLVNNAFKYTAEGGKINLTSKTEEHQLIIKVKDNGPGIPKKIQQRVFDRFFKVNENNHEGTGIGLSLVKEYTESLEGEVKLISAENKGATFIVSIPIKPQRTEESLDNFELPTEEEYIKPVLMVIEDHADLNEFICTSFEKDFHCIAAFDGQQALQKIKMQTPDIIITDLMMPNMDGNEFVQKVKNSEDLEHIPIVVLSAKSQIESRIDLYEIGADNFLVKPFDVNELKAVVFNVIEQRKKLIGKFREKYLLEPTNQVPNNEFSEDDSSDENELVKAAIQLVSEQLDNADLNVSFLTKSLNVGRNKFQKEIKSCTGLTPVEFIRSIRLNEAMKLLKKGELNISEVAYSVGFNNLSYFSRSFKSEFGQLPSDVVN